MSDRKNRKWTVSDELLNLLGFGGVLVVEEQSYEVDGMCRVWAKIGVRRASCVGRTK
jgi:hypothetical protein